MQPEIDAGQERARAEGYGRVVPHICDAPSSAVLASLHAGHGPRCDCLLLSAATQGCAHAVTFSYCRHVLQKRYSMTCMHGDMAPRQPTVKVPEKWHDLGEIDAVKAILLTNN
jgi:hypothetical protein